MTGREKINKMTNEELAKLLEKGSCKICVYTKSPCGGLNCAAGVELWLSREVKDNEVRASD